LLSHIPKIQNSVVKVWDVSKHELLVDLGQIGYDFGSLTTRIPLKLIKPTSNPVGSVAASSDGRILAFGCAPSGDPPLAEVKLWDRVTEQEIRAVRGHTGTIADLVFTADGKTLATGSTDKTIKLWEVATGKELTTLQGYSGHSSCMALTSDLKALATAGGENSISIWDLSGVRRTDK
jgi:WD40 repeat protein